MRRSPATIVILAWNAWESTEACLDSLLAHPRGPGSGGGGGQRIDRRHRTPARPLPLDRRRHQCREPRIRRRLQRRCRHRPPRHPRLSEQRHRSLGPLARSPHRPLRRGRRRGGDRAPVELRLRATGGRGRLLPPGGHVGHAPVRPVLGRIAPGPDDGDRTAGRVSAWPCAVPLSSSSGDSTPPTASAATRTTTCAAGSWPSGQRAAHHP